MKSLKYIVKENLKFKINRDAKVSEYYPKTWDELRQIIEQRYKEQGPGTKEKPIDFNDIDVSGMTTFYSSSHDYNSYDFNGVGLFQETRFEYIDISAWDVSNVNSMNSMFCDCYKLTSVGNLSNWDVSNVKDMRHMFRYCKNLKSVRDLFNWNVSNVEDMTCMFKYSGITNKPKWYKK